MDQKRSFSDLVAAATGVPQTCGTCSGCGSPLYVGYHVAGALRALGEAQEQTGANSVGDRSRLLQSVLQYHLALGCGVCARCMVWHETQAPFAEDAEALDAMVRFVVGLDDLKPDPLGPLSVSRKVNHA